MPLYLQRFAASRFAFRSSAANVAGSGLAVELPRTFRSVAAARFAVALRGVAAAAAGGQAAQRHSVLDALAELTALFEYRHQRQHRGHDGPPLVEIAFDGTRLVQRKMGFRRKVGTGRYPTAGTPGKEFQGLVVVNLS